MLSVVLSIVIAYLSLTILALAVESFSVPFDLAARDNRLYYDRGPQDSWE